ncbi:MAG TPA: hypothetical protein VKY92_23090, partial [Verrucomicrobiae bacterium]|nr:hypothetical protein [Verrucomicrobiae bacterium]
MAKIKFPYTVKNDGTTLTATIYRKIREKQIKDKRVHYTDYTLAYYQNGERHTKSSSDFEALKTTGKELLKDLSEGRAEPHPLSASQRNDYNRANK